MTIRSPSPRNQADCTLRPMSGINVVLPHERVRGGRVRQTIQVRPISGTEEEFLLEQGHTLSTSRQATALLARCVQTAEGSAQDEQAIRRLVIGDREVLLLELQRLMFGDRLSCVANCPAPACGSRMDFEITVAALLDRQVPPPRRPLEARVESGGHEWRSHFRLPTVADLDCTTELAARDPDAAAELLLRRCLLGLWCDGREIEPDQAPQALVDAMEDEITASDPYAETLLSASCPECRARFQIQFDPASYLFRQLGGGRRGQLFEEVHMLALHYHWSEADILHMSRTRRRLYLELLDDWRPRDR